MAGNCSIVRGRSDANPPPARISETNVCNRKHGRVSDTSTDPLQPSVYSMTLALTILFGFLTVVVWLGVVAVVLMPAVRDRARPHLIGAASAVTGTAAMGSLYLSEVAGYVPCELCWAQRIFAYPLAVITTVALIRRRRDVWTYAAPVAAIGLVISIWHVIVQRLPAAGGSCDPANPCSAIYVERFGFITIPVMSGTAFLAVLVLAWVAHQHDAAFVTDCD